MNRWLAVWSRAVVVPAWRRAAGVWIGAGIAAAVIFGPTGMQPHDLTRLALGIPAVGAVLACTWLLVFVPTARVIVRAEAARYLRSLPGPRVAPILVGAAAFVLLQLPWLALWIAGEGVRGLAVVCALSAAIAAVAAVRLRPRAARWPRWMRDRQALRGVYIRALQRRAGDALVRGVGLAILAGLAAALLVHNNGLVGRDAVGLGAGTITVILLPGLAGALLPLVEAQRATRWLASSLGISEAARVVVLASVVAAVYIAAALIATAALWFALATLLHAPADSPAGRHMPLDVPPAATVAWVGGFATGLALATALFATRALVRAESDDSSPAVRVVVGAVVAAAASVFCVGWLGPAGIALALVLGIAALATAAPARSA